MWLAHHHEYALLAARCSISSGTPGHGLDYAEPDQLDEQQRQQPPWISRHRGKSGDLGLEKKLGGGRKGRIWSFGSLSAEKSPPSARAKQRRKQSGEGRNRGDN